MVQRVRQSGAIVWLFWSLSSMRRCQRRACLVLVLARSRCLAVPPGALASPYPWIGLSGFGDAAPSVAGRESSDC